MIRETKENPNFGLLLCGHHATEISKRHNKTTRVFFYMSKQSEAKRGHTFLNTLFLTSKPRKLNTV